MSILPYTSYTPSTLPPSPSTPSTLSGRIRIDLTSPASAEALSSIIKKMTLVSALLPDDKKGKKAMLKEVMVGVREMIEKVGDASVVNIEAVLPIASHLSTSGGIGSAFLDAGCSFIVFPVDDGDDSMGQACIDAVEICRLPIDKVILSFSSTIKVTQTSLQLSKLLSLSNVFNFIVDDVEVVKNDELYVTPFSVLMLQSPNLKTIFTLPSTTAPEHATEIKKAYKNVQLCLLNPTTSQAMDILKTYLVTDRPDGLYTTVVCTRQGVSLGLVYSSLLSIQTAIECKRGVYYSRSRNGLWRKGDTSGCYQILHRIDLDCDGDALRFMVTQLAPEGCEPAFCHLNTLSCWGASEFGTADLEKTLKNRLGNAPEGSYTKRLFNDETLLKNKLVEEALEVAEATSPSHVAEEMADLLYFLMVKGTKHGVGMDEVCKVLDLRARKVTRRPGNSKVERIKEGEDVINASKK